MALGRGPGRRSIRPSGPCSPTSNGDGPPLALPGDEAFAAGAPELNRAYAEAWLVCRYVAERYSAARLGRLYAELDRGRSLDEASRAALGVGADELVAGWRRYLVAARPSGLTWPGP